MTRKSNATSPTVSHIIDTFENELKEFDQLDNDQVERLIALIRDDPAINGSKVQEAIFPSENESEH